MAIAAGNKKYFNFIIPSFLILWLGFYVFPRSEKIFHADLYFNPTQDGKMAGPGNLPTFFSIKTGGPPLG